MIAQQGEKVYGKIMVILIFFTNITIVLQTTSLHRIAKTAQIGDRKKARRETIADPRFAILLCAASEALIGREEWWFQSRELSNIAWAIAKLGIAADSAELDVTRLETLMMLICLLYTSPSPRDGLLSRMPSSA